MKLRLPDGPPPPGVGIAKRVIETRRLRMWLEAGWSQETSWQVFEAASVVRRNYLSLFLGTRQKRITENTEELREHREAHKEIRSLCSLFCSVHSVIRFLRAAAITDRKSTRQNSSHLGISYAVFC